MIKQVRNCLYAHKSNIEELSEKLDVKEQGFLMDFIYNFMSEDFDVIKFDKENKHISIIKCIEWDKVFEPKILNVDIYTYDLKHIKHIKYNNNNPIYHNKWMFVSNDYSGFDINESKERTKMLEITIPCYSTIKNKIGRINFWSELLKQYNIEL